MRAAKRPSAVVDEQHCWTELNGVVAPKKLSTVRKPRPRHKLWALAEFDQLFLAPELQGPSAIAIVILLSLRAAPIESYESYHCSDANQTAHLGIAP